MWLRLGRAGGMAGGALILMLLTGCGAGSIAQMRATESDSPTSTPDASASPEPTRSESTESALSFDLPPEIDYEPVGRRVADDGAVIRQWRFKLQDSGLYCVVIAGEQPGFGGAFPASALAAFRANRDPGGSIHENQATSPIDGTLAGVRQRSSYPLAVADGGSATGELMVRQYLTRDGTLISLNAAGPADDAELCKLASIVESLRVSSVSDQTNQAAPRNGEWTP